MIFPVFFNAEELAQSPHLFAITSKGEAAVDEWVEFEQSLIEALKPPSHGVVFWSWERVARDSEKKEIIRKFCAQ